MLLGIKVYPQKTIIILKVDILLQNYHSIVKQLVAMFR
jgi:hypothetical protein